MIIMINGAFGVGKTTVANELLKVINNSMLYDPEEVGFMLRNILIENIIHSNEKTDNFQDLELWKVLVVKVAGLLKQKYRKNLIVPMTIFNKEYFQYIVQGFRGIEETYHFCLMAKEETIYERLKKRGEIEGNWCYQQTKKCMVAYNDKSFEQFIDTEGVNVNNIVSDILTTILKRFDKINGRG
jgi:hypothetical protein